VGSVEQATLAGDTGGMAAADILRRLRCLRCLFTNERVRKKDFFWWYATKKYIFLGFRFAETLTANTANAATPRHLPPTGSGIIGDKTWDFIF
jgi:hypothetical protein